MLDCKDYNIIDWNLMLICGLTKIQLARKVVIVGLDKLQN